MGVREKLTTVLGELSGLFEEWSTDQVETLAKEIEAAPRIFIAGAGRTGLVMQAFAMRLMHLGLRVHVVGDVTTPSIAKEDLLLIGSRSGETEGLLALTRRAEPIGPRTVIISASPESLLASSANLLVVLPTWPKIAETRPSVQPIGSLFEQSLLVLLDALVLHLMETLGVEAALMAGRHANIE